MKELLSNVELHGCSAASSDKGGESSHVGASPGKEAQQHRPPTMPSSAHMLAWLHCTAREIGHPVPSTPAAALMADSNPVTYSLQNPRHPRKRKLGTAEVPSSSQVPFDMRGRPFRRPSIMQ